MRTDFLSNSMSGCYKLFRRDTLSCFQIQNNEVVLIASILVYSGCHDFLYVFTTWYKKRKNYKVFSTH